MKKNFLTKMGAVLVSTAMLLSGVTAVCAEDTAVEATDGYFWLEGENGNGSGEWYNVDNASFNGGKVKAISTENEAAGGNRITYKINVTEAGKYKTYINSTQAGYVWASEAKLYIDDTEIALTKLTGEVWCGNWSLQWFSGAETLLETGEHTVTYKLAAPRSQDNKVYYGALDSIAIMPVDYTMTAKVGERPVAPKTYISQWLEETDAATKSGAFYSVSDAGLSEGKALQMSDPNAPGSEGYKIDFQTNIKETGEYDIYYRGNIPNEWMSKPDLLVDGEKQESTAVKDEGWLGQLTLGWNKATVELSKGQHTIRFALIDSRAANTNTWIGMFDCMVILPKGSPFNITANGIADTKIEYELCAAMAGVNLSAVTSDITLPSETESGAAITWTSSDTDVITNDGKVTRGNTDKEVKLTAVTGDYEKTFTVTVKKLVEFDVDSFTLSGNVTTGETIRANAEVKYNMGTSKNVTLIIALYKADGEMISANIDTKDITAAGAELSTTLTVPSDISEGAYAAAYLWNDINDLKPIVPSIGK